MNQLALTNGNMDNEIAPPSGGYDPKVTPMSIATISSGFEKGDFLVREEKGQRVVSQKFSLSGCCNFDIHCQCLIDSNCFTCVYSTLISSKRHLITLPTKDISECRRKTRWSGWIPWTMFTLVWRGVWNTIQENCWWCSTGPSQRHRVNLVEDS